MTCMPKFMTAPRPCVTITGSNGRQIHEYSIPDGAEDIILALQWMVTKYDDVDIEYGENYGAPYAHIWGYVKEGNQ